jgi:hypothetical protein
MNSQMYNTVGAQNPGMFNVLTQGVSNAVSGAGFLVKKGTNTIGLTTPAAMGGRRRRRSSKRRSAHKKRTNRNKTRTNRNKTRTNRNKNRK